MKIIKYSIYGITLITLIKCSTLSKTTTTTTTSPISDTELTTAQKKWSDVKMENLTAGHLVYNSKCNKCHGLVNIPDYNEAQWEKLIAAMAPKAKLTTQETDDLTKYIYAKRESASK